MALAEIFGPKAYCEVDFKKIARAIGKNDAVIMRHAQAFEGAARWYRLHRKSDKAQRLAPNVMQRRMTQIGNAARKLLRHLQITDPAQASDGPGIAVLEALASTDDGTEDAVILATARLGRLVEILDAVDATRQLECLAHRGAQDVVQVGKLIVPKGHHGKAAVNDWIAAMMSIYKQLTGKNPGTSVIAPGGQDRGKAAGPLIRFLAAAGKPLDIMYSADSWRGRVRDILTNGRSQK